ncbi:MAG: hypothetical protein IPG08_10390 [Sphingobacteriaceae bacterium]|nr:hypothetical protein [Sphingobacteriaceae bacterium]
MKKLFALVVPVFIAGIAMSQSAVSIANGNWTNPLTWNCTCVPLPGYSVTVNHSVTLNTSFTFTSAGITINSGGSVAQDNGTRDILINGGSVTNNGYLNVRFILAQAGAWANSGTITARSIDNHINFTNIGVIKSVDSMRNNAVMINNGKMLNVDSIMHTGTFTNNGQCTHHFITNTGTLTNNNYLSFTDITNIGTFTNTDSIIGSRSMFNKGRWTNTSGALVSLNKSLLNKIFL